VSQPDTYYRFEDYLQGTGGYDIHGEWEPGLAYVALRLQTFPVLKHTPKGVWIRDSGGARRFIFHIWRKRYALPSIDEAKTSFLRRKERQAGIYEARAKSARTAIALMKKDAYRCPNTPPWSYSSKLSI
jgi:hypothetical protein